MTAPSEREPGELWMTTHFSLTSEVTGYTVDRADDLIRVGVDYLARADLPFEQGCITFVALNGTFRYRFAGVEDAHMLLFERVDT